MVTTLKMVAGVEFYVQLCTYTDFDNLGIFNDTKGRPGNYVTIDPNRTEEFEWDLSSKFQSLLGWQMYIIAPELGRPFIDTNMTRNLFIPNNIPTIDSGKKAIHHLYAGTIDGLPVLAGLNVETPEHYTPQRPQYGLDFRVCSPPRTMDDDFVSKIERAIFPVLKQYSVQQKSA